MLCEWSILPSSALVRREDALAIGFPEWTKDSEDVIFFAALRARGPFCFVPKALTGYRRSATQQTQAVEFPIKSAMSRFEWLQRREAGYHPEEAKRAAAQLAAQLAAAHDIAYWRRDSQVCERYERRLT